MNTLDVILLIPVLFGFMRGLWTGFIQEIAGIVGVAVGIIAGYLFNEQLVHVLNQDFEMSEESANIAAFILLFVAGFLLVMITARILTKGVSMAALGPINRLLGGVFAGVKYGVFAIILLTLFNRINDSANLIEREELEESVVYNTYSELSALLWDYVPENDYQLDMESIQDRLDPR